jgi:hypothetical protein
MINRLVLNNEKATELTGRRRSQNLQREAVGLLDRLSQSWFVSFLKGK